MHLSLCVTVAFDDDDDSIDSIHFADQHYFSTRARDHERTLHTQALNNYWGPLGGPSGRTV